MPEQTEKNYENRRNLEQKFTALKQKIEERRNQVYKMNVLNYTNEEIATKFGVSLSTIEKDLSLHEILLCKIDQRNNRNGTYKKSTRCIYSN